ncbi:MAG: serine hydrolase [Sphingomonas sp.]|nr:serine hydrolase [Sphingomonas sp.]
MSGFSVTRRQALALSSGGLATLATPAWARHALLDDGLAAKADAVVAAFMEKFETPGIGVAVVRPGVEPFLKGYGVRTMGQAAPVDVHTRFGIASNSKAFTAAALAMLVDAGKLDWEDPVTKHIPEFRMYDPAVTAMMTVRDLLVHRSGLPLGAGDLMFFPASSHVPEDALTALPYLKPARGFRAGYDYDNILYIVAGLLIARVSGERWEDFVSTRLLRPLGMADAVPSRDMLDTPNVAGRHARLGPPVRGMGAMEVVQPDESVMMNAAGGIQASVSDIAHWLSAQMAFGVLPDGERLWSREQAMEMWTPQTIIGASNGPTPEYPARPVTTTYALGWFCQDYRGERLIQHSGGLSGQVTQTAMLPGRGIGVAVFSNTEDGVSAGIRNALLDHLIGAPAFDWVNWLDTRVASYQQQSLAAISGGIDTAPEGGPSLPLSAYAGRYRDPWYGDIVVSEKDGGLFIDFTPTPVFKSPLTPWGPDAFRTNFAKDAGEDAVVTFTVADGKVTGVTMKPLSPLADFSYDYQHLDFAPVQ